MVGYLPRDVYKRQPVGHAALEGQAVHIHIQRHPPGGREEQEQALRCQQGGEEPDCPPSAALPAGPLDRSQQKRQVHHRHPHHLEETAPGPLGIGKALLGQVLSSAEESGGLDAQEQQVQRRHRRQHDGEAQAVYPAAGCGSGPFQGLSLIHI